MTEEGSTSPAGTPESEAANARKRPKSKFGCLPCKRRKLKCDEQRPQCRRCQIAGLGCHFPSHLLADGDPDPGTAPAPTLQLLDLDLMHHYSTSVYATFTCDVSLQHIWRDSVFQLALRCEYVMRSLLAVSAIHLAKLRPEKKELYLSTAFSHHAAALQAAAPLLSDLKGGDAKNLFIFSSLTIFFVLGSPRTSSQGTLLLEETDFPDWLFLLRGTKSLLLTLRDTSAEGELGPMFECHHHRWLALHPTEFAPSVEQRALDQLHAVVRARVTDPDACVIYDRAIQQLRGQFHVLSTSPPRSTDIATVFISIYELIDDFFPLLKIPTQEAVVIFAFFSVLFKATEFHTWMEGWADHLISRVQTLVDRDHRAWINWPVAEIERLGRLSRDERSQ